MTQILGLLGAAGSGKSTAAKHLVERYGARIYTLAAPLKELVGNAFGLTHDQLYGPQEFKEAVDARYNVSPRWLFQRIGTEGFRKVFGPDFWWEYQLKKIREEKPSLAVVDDVRFVNEAAGLKEAGALILRIHRTNRNTTTDASHASEAEWKTAPATHAIDNNRTVKDFKDRLDEILRYAGIYPTSLL